MKRLIFITLIAFCLSGRAMANECTPEMAEDMSNDVMEEAIKTIQRYLVNARQLKLEKDKIGLVLVARPQAIPDKLAPLIIDLNKLAELVNTRSPAACEASERLREKYRL